MLPRIGFVVLVSSLAGCSAITGTIGSRFGGEAASAADRSLRAAVSAGPTITAAGGLSGRRPDASIALGYFGSALGERRLALPGGFHSADLPALAQSDLALVLGAEGGYQFRDASGFVALQFGAGWSAFSGSMRLVTKFDADTLGFAIGPRAQWHLRLGRGAQQAEIQIFVQAEFAVASQDRFAHQLFGGASYLFDLY